MKKTTLTLTEDVHQRLASIAGRRGWTLDQMLQDLIDGALQQDSARRRFVQINPLIESQLAQLELQGAETSAEASMGQSAAHDQHTACSAVSGMKSAVS